ncbi:ATP-binding domain-containing protein [Consotaella aegiceratis]|uniref:ATP-binding domain-containing protein n=1 Tax=Consotaella aegiceratis TaxID=3097961 RepID=UPI002F408BE1
MFRRLEAVLDDSFVVFYSRPWLGLRPDGEEIDGECDFIVAHPELGMLTLEVKGGAVAYDPRTERWTSRDRWKVTHNIKNPVQQARSAKYELLKKLNASPHWKSRRIRARHGIILPHSSVPPGDLGADMPRHIFCFAEQFEDGVRDWILERFGDAPPDEGRTKELGRDGVQALEKILAKPFQLRTPLGTVLSRDDAALQVLTQQQFHILRAIEAVPRAAIGGGAGTGKTVLAMEEAKRRAEDGLRTLFVCYNRGLATETRRHFKDSPPVSVMTFHELCAEMTRRADIPHPGDVSETRLFEEIWPELLMQAFERLPDERYDAIIVDEGQDFLPLWWTVVESALDPEGPGMFRIFYDNNQRVYASAIKLPEDVDLVPIRLTLNLRNTRRIHELVRQHYSGHEIEAVGPEGVEVHWITVKSPDDLRQSISDCVARLETLERVSCEDIAVLVGTVKAIETIAPQRRLGAFSTARCDEDTQSRIVVDSIRRFKGLERPVAVIAATSDIVTNRELPYVALSRARTHLVIVGTERILDRIRVAIK